MTGLLNDVMHERAESLETAPPNVAAIIRAGERRVTRRRTAWVGGGVAAGLAIAAIAPLALGGDGPSTRGIAPAASFAEGQVVYSLGSTIHAGPQKIEAERDVFTLATTDRGVVFSDEPGQVWSSTGGAPTRVGQSGGEGVELVGGDDLAAWLDTSAGTATFTVLDQGSGEIHRLPAQGEPGDGERGATVAVDAIDGDTVYVHDDRGPIAWEPASGETTVLKTVPGELVDVYDVEDGVFAYDVSDGRDTGTGMDEEEPQQRVGRSLTDGVGVEIWNARISPDGAHLISEVADENVIVDTATGRRLPFDNQGYSFLVGYHWLDDETYAAIAFRSNSDPQPELLRCDLQSGDCEVAVDGLPADVLMSIPTSS